MKFAFVLSFVLGPEWRTRFESWEIAPQKRVRHAVSLLIVGISESPALEAAAAEEFLHAEIS